ncbi:MAG TPA: D-alanyl-D-alanine carboxypeptidase [Blastocatellia bacterium]|nr:D-alanyl-D-alanine carboxypeptidase [Blastocatellia bacterium]
MKRITFLPLLILLLPSNAGKPATRALYEAAPAQSVQERRELQAVLGYKEALRSRGQNLTDQGLIVETLDGRQSLGEFNADLTFNPASVMKLATSLVALSKFSPDHRYRTNFLADGEIDQATRKLEGDLVVEGGADPMFSAVDADEVARELARVGISRVTGSLRMCGPFYYYARGYTSNLSRETSSVKLRSALERAGMKIEGATVFGEKSGEILVSHYSDQLLNILLYQNAHSSNAVAEVVGESAGGPQAVQNYLVRKLGLRDGEIHVGSTSGLYFNRITPRASLKVLRALLQTLDGYSLKPEDIMAVAGIDSGTMRARLAREDLRGSVIAKTGTLVSMDKGVSTLVGVVYTKAHGPVVFAIFNSDGSVNLYRRLQDQFLEQVIAEEGGGVPVGRFEDALAEAEHGSINQILYKHRPRSPESSAD